MGLHVHSVLLMILFGECSMGYTLAGLHSVDQFIGDGEPYSGKVGKQRTPVSWFKSNHATNPHSLNTVFQLSLEYC